MSAHHLTAEVSRVIRSSSFATSVIVLETSREDAIETFAGRLKEFYADPHDPLQIDDIIAVPVFDRVLTEAGSRPMDASFVTEAPAPEQGEEEQSDLGAGWWADCEQLVRPDNLPADLDAFRRSLPSDIEPELNWQDTKKHTFLVKVLRRYTDDEPIVALVLARNAPLAAWIWRHNAKGTPLSHNPIQVEPCCPVFKAAPPEPAPDSESPA